MKKLVAAVLIALLVLVAAEMILHRGGVVSIAPTLVPGDTALLVHFPDARRTADRWKGTALAKIANEPAVRAFLKKPREQIPDGGAMQRQLDQLLACEPREVFLAVTAPAGAEPGVLAGFTFDGKKTDADALLDSLKKEARRTSPAGKSDLIKHGGAEIETFTDGKSVFAATIKGHWCFAATDLDLLKSALDRLDGLRGAKMLRETPAFQSSLARMPRDYEALVFVQPKTFYSRIEPMLQAGGGGMEKQIAGLKQIEAFALATKIEGERMHDTMFTLHPAAPSRQTITRGALAMTSTDALLFYDARLPAPESLDLKKNPTVAAATEVVGEWLGWLDKLAKALNSTGGELAVQMDLASGAMQPGLIVSIETRDEAGAAKLAEAIAGSPADAGVWKHEQVEGAPVYTLNLSGIAALLSPAMLVSGRFVIVGLDLETVKAAAARAKTGTGGALAKNAGFRAAEGSVVKPTEAFGYADSRILFERLYETARPALVLWLAMSPEAGKTVDASKLPPVEAIAKHLGPVVYSQAAVDNGTLAESIGPVTVGQILIGLVGMGGVAGTQMQDQIQQIVPALPGQAAPHSPGKSPAPATPGPVAPGK